VRRAEPIAAAGGVLLLVSLFVGWYSLERRGDAHNLASPELAAVLGGEGTPWRAFSVVDVVLAVAALLALAVAISRRAAVLGIVLGWTAVVLVAFRIEDPPFADVEIRAGAWLALAGALLAWTGSWLARRGGRLSGLVAGAGGALLAVSLFLTWYGVEPLLGDPDGLAASLLDPEPPDGRNEATLAYGVSVATGTTSGWQSFAVTDVALALAAAVAIAVPLVSLRARGPARPIAIAVVASTVTALAAALVAVRMLFPPGPDEFYGVEFVTTPAIGAWLSLAGALVAFLGSWLSMRDESTPGATAPDIPRRPAPNITT
jgi:hypothetical protein